MPYFKELPNIAYQSPLSHRNSSTDYIVIKNIFRRTKLADYLKDAASIFQKFVIGDGDRPDTVAGITNIRHQWPLQDYQVYDYALSKYGSEEKMNEIKYHQTFEIRDEQDRQILPPDLIVDVDFKIDGTAHKFPSTTRYTIRTDAGYKQLDDKDEFTVATDNIARAVTNLEYEYSENEKKREIDILNSGYLQTFLNDLRDIVRYDLSSSYISPNLAATENTEVINP